MTAANGGPARAHSLIFTGLVLLSLCLRGPLVAVSTVTTDLSAELGMSATAVGLLTSLPVLCFGIAAPGASVAIARLGVERAALITLFGVLIGTLVRSAGGVSAALVGTVLMGIAITVGNVVAPVVIGRDFRGQAAILTGSYSAVLNIGSMLTLTVTGPVAAQFGWQVALAMWVVLPLAAVVPWWPLARRRVRPEFVPVTTAAPSGGSDGRPMTPGEPGPAAAAAPSTARQPAPQRSVLRNPATWMLTVAFAGQAFAYYGLTAWLPTLLADEQGMTRGEAGAASSIFQIAALIGAFGTPVIINRFGGPLAAFLVNGVLWSCLPLGLLFAPGLWGCGVRAAGRRRVVGS